MSIKTISKGVAAMITVKLLLFAGTAVYAQQAQSVSAPRTLSYQGVLTSTGTPGNILGVNRLLTVTLYGDANGTIKLWQSTMNTPIDSNGVFNCMLGTADNPLPQPSVMDRAIWLGVAVDNGTELRPLSQVTASAYAINVADSAITSQKIATGAVGTQSLADGSITTSKLADSSITASKMNMNYVSSISVNGQPITGTGTNLNIVAGDGVNATWVPDQSTLTLSGTTSGTGYHTAAWTGLGIGNFSPGTTDFIGGGLDNTIDAPNPSGGLENTIPGGDSNWIGKNSIQNAIGGGGFNKIWPSSGSNATVEFNTIAGGDSNNIANKGALDNYPKIGNFIGGGTLNTINSTYSVIGGGNSNNIVNPLGYSTIAGGQNNLITNQTTLGTNPPDENNNYHFIGGGQNNKIISEINAGSENGTLGYGTIAGGENNTICGPAWGFIGGGEFNVISNENPTRDDDHGDKMERDAISGGLSNSIDTISSYSFIGGGWGNHIAGKGTWNNIDSSFHDSASADRNIIGGGYYNMISAVRDGAIAGGNGNTILAAIGDNGDVASIGGGYLNKTQYQFSNIPGGDGLTTDGEAQTVIGAGNIEAGNSHIIYSSLMNANDDRIFEVGSPVFRDGGSGPNWYATNAFEVSYNGHSIVYHTNGTSIPGGGTPPVFQGATYVESPVYAWGEIAANSMPVGDANFGISQCVHCGPGVYMISLCPQDPYDPHKIVDITRASVTVTVVNNDISDIVTPPPPPPVSDGGSGGSIQSSVTDKVIPDSMILAARGTIGYPSSAMMPQTDTLPNDTLPITVSYGCGYATASQIGVLVSTYGPVYANSFIVRTYKSAASEQTCSPMDLPFFFKVCHR